MTESKVSQFSVLLVDDDRAFLEMSRETFASLSDGAWQIHIAVNAAETSALLQHEPVDLAVLDVRMPEIDGLQLMEIIHREHPDLLKVFLTGFSDQSERLSGLESGAALYLEKPENLAGFRNVYATLHELLKWHRKQGPQGVLRHASILDVVKLECTSGNSRVLEVISTEAEGMIYIKDGVIIHAESPGRRGQSAFTHLCALPDAEFHLRSFADPPERSVTRQWEFLYLEATQLREQLRQVAEAAPADQTPRLEEPSPPPTEEGLVIRGNQSFAPLRPEEPALAPAAESPPLVDRTTPAPERPSAPRPPEPTELRLLHHQPSAAESSAALEPTLAPAPAREPPPAPLPIAEHEELDQVRIQEVLVCSTQREVLYEWESPQGELRLRLVEGLHEKAGQISQHFPLGAFDRLEAQSAHGRMVIHFQADTAILFRSNTECEPAYQESSVLHQSLAGWLARRSNIRGAYACGIIRPSQQALSQSSSADFPVPPLSVAWRCVRDTFELVDEQEFDPWQLRWLYDRAQLYAVRRGDGKVLGMFLSKDPQVLDVEGVERVFAEFKSLDAV